jgi:periplasmic divalent cation tolerance protein
MSMNEFIIILITCASSEEAERITEALVNEKLIACGNIVSGVQSIFFWQGKISKENEFLIIAKSVKKEFSSIVARVKTLHSYIVPEIIALPLVEGSADYLRWIEETLQ